MFQRFATIGAAAVLSVALLLGWWWFGSPPPLPSIVSLPSEPVRSVAHGQAESDAQGSLIRISQCWLLDKDTGWPLGKEVVGLKRIDSSESREVETNAEGLIPGLVPGVWTLVSPAEHFEVTTTTIVTGDNRVLVTALVWVSITFSEAGGQVPWPSRLVDIRLLPATLVRDTVPKLLLGDAGSTEGSTEVRHGSDHLVLPAHSGLCVVALGASVMSVRPSNELWIGRQKGSVITPGDFKDVKCQVSRPIEGRAGEKVFIVVMLYQECSLEVNCGNISYVEQITVTLSKAGRQGELGVLKTWLPVAEKTRKCKKSGELIDNAAPVVFGGLTPGAYRADMVARCGGGAIVVGMAWRVLADGANSYVSMDERRGRWALTLTEMPEGCKLILRGTVDAYGWDEDLPELAQTIALDGVSGSRVIIDGLLEATGTVDVIGPTSKRIKYNLARESQYSVK